MMVSFDPPSIVPSPQQVAYGIALATISMRETFGMEPWAWQTDILAHLFVMVKVCEPDFLVRSTCGGKSMVRNVYAS